MRGEGVSAYNAGVGIVVVPGVVVRSSTSSSAPQSSK